MFDLEAMHQKVNLTRPGMPLVMGVLNVTPDSFSDGMATVRQEIVEKRILQMIEAGVDIIDVGGESTRPGASFVSLEEELQRVVPVIEWIVDRFDVALSVDTYKTEVMAQSIASGVSIINDVNALQAKGALDCVANSQVTVCLMHKQGEPATMQASPFYNNVVDEVKAFLQARASACELAGIEKNRIILDPGFGFGKTLEHNTELFANLADLQGLGYSVLVGVSRKRMIGEILNDAPVDKRIHGSVAAAVLAGMKGADIVRVHDVGPTVEALKVVAHLL